MLLHGIDSYDDCKQQVNTHLKSLASTFNLRNKSPLRMFASAVIQISGQFS